MSEINASSSANLGNWSVPSGRPSSVIEFKAEQHKLEQMMKEAERLAELTRVNQGIVGTPVTSPTEVKLPTPELSSELMRVAERLGVKIGYRQVLDKDGRPFWQAVVETRRGEMTYYVNPSTVRLMGSDHAWIRAFAALGLVDHPSESVSENTQEGRLPFDIQKAVAKQFLQTWTVTPHPSQP